MDASQRILEADFGRFRVAATGREKILSRTVYKECEIRLTLRVLGYRYGEDIYFSFAVLFGSFYRSRKFEYIYTHTHTA